MTIKEARQAAGLSQAKMGELLEIPRRTIQEWESGRRNPPAYVERLVVKELMRIAEKNRKMRRFNINKYSAEVEYTVNLRERRDTFKTGCAVDLDSDPELIATLDTKEEAIEFLKNEKYKPTLESFTSVFVYNRITEYGYEEVELDEDGDECEWFGIDFVYGYEYDMDAGELKISLQA